MKEMDPEIVALLKGDAFPSPPDLFAMCDRIRERNEPKKPREEHPLMVALKWELAEASSNYFSSINSLIRSLLLDLKARTPAIEGIELNEDGWMFLPEDLHLTYVYPGGTKLWSINGLMPYIGIGLIPEGWTDATITSATQLEQLLYELASLQYHWHEDDGEKNISYLFHRAHVRIHV